MGLSQYIIDIIESYEEKIINDIPIKDLIYDLRAKKILTRENVEELENIVSVKKRLNTRFLDILLTREDDDFYKFCKLLQRNQATAIKNFGNKLEKEALAKKPSNDQPSSSATNADQGGNDSNDGAKQFDAFLSHSWSNKPHVTTVKTFLEEKGISCWIDDKQLSGGSKLLPEIATAIRNSKVFIPFMSKKYKESKNCFMEISYANNKDKTIIPVIIEDIDPKKDLISSTGNDLLIYVSEDLYVKIIVTDPPTPVMNTKLEELAKSVKRFLPKKEDNTDA